MEYIVDEQKAMKKWSPVLENLGVSDIDKKTWMSVYAEMHSLSLNENVAYSTLGNLKGMGAVVAPQAGSPGAVWTNGGTQGSGDIAQNLLPVSMKIAAHTIGLDLVSVKPTASPKVDLLFIDFKYDNNPLDVNADEKPLVFKVVTTSSSLATALDLVIAGNGAKEIVGGLDKRLFVALPGAGGAIPTPATSEPTGTKDGVLEFLGYSRIDGYPMFRSYRQNNNGAAGGYTFDQTKNTFAVNEIITDVITSGVSYHNGTATGTTGVLAGVAIQLVSSMEDNLPGFVSNWSIDTSMKRETSEYTYPGVIGTDVFTKSFQIGDIEISAALKRTQIEDIKASTGIDITQKMESVLINELTQKISKEIVSKVKSLGVQNRASHTVPKVNGVSIFDFNVDAYVAVNGPAPGGETYHSIQRKLVTKINNASNYIFTEGRVGPAQYLITNGTIASVLQDVVGYTINPVNAGKINTNGQLYPLGSIGNILIYVDPYQKYDDKTIYLGRKNTIDQPGLMFVPYLMAQSLQLISEASFAPRLLIRSRYAVVDCGFFPEKQFISLNVTDTNGVLA